MDTRKIMEVFKTAADNGMTGLRLRIKDYVIKKAPDHGKNKGSLYVTKAGDYMGKISPENQFFPAFVGKEDIESIQKIVDEPMSEAILHGHRTGSCAICGRLLTNHDSIALGIGPICAEKVGAYLPQEVLDKIKEESFPTKLPIIEIPDDF